MATRILGPTGSKKRRRFLFVPMLCIAAIALFWIGSAQAVHELGVFQLDGNPWVFAPSGTNASQPNYASRTDAGQLPEDWDLICIKHLNTLTNEPGTCNNDTGYVLPNAGTLNAAVTNATATTITVQETGGNDVPVLNPSATNPFAIQIANTCTTPTSCAGTAEEMLVTGRSPATAAGGLHDYTVQRGFNSTVADNHAAAARVYIGTFSNPSSFKTDLVKNSSDDVLTQGTKDDNDIPSWTYKFGSEGTAKDDLNHAFAAEYTCGNTTACTSHNAVGTRSSCSAATGGATTGPRTWRSGSSSTGSRRRPAASSPRTGKPWPPTGAIRPPTRRGTSRSAATSSCPVNARPATC